MGLKESLKQRIDAQLAGSQGERKTRSGFAKRDYDFNKNDFSFSKYLRGALCNDWERADMEKREFTRLNKASYNGAVGSQGGFLVPSETTQDIIKALNDQVVIRNLGATVYPMNGNELKIRRADNNVQTHWVGQDDSPAENTNVDFLERDSLRLKKLMALVSLDNDLLADADPSIETMVKENIVEEFAREEDYVALEGSGSNQPLGLYLDPDVNTKVLDAAPSWTDLVDMQDRLEGNNARRGNLTWLMPTKLRNYFRKMTDGNDRPLWTDGDIQRGEPDRFLGLPVETSNIMSTSVDSSGNLTGGSYTYCILGNFSDLAIGQKAGEHIKMANSGSANDAFENDETKLRAKMRIDFLARRPESFEVLTALDIS